MQVTVVGTGYVGLVAGACLADFGHRVRCVDKDAALVERLRKGEIHIFEPGLAEIVARTAADGRLVFETDLGSATDAEVVLLAVGTPETADGKADLSAIFAVIDALGPTLAREVVVATKSTVPVGTGDELERRLRAIAKVPVHVVSNPEFLKEGDAVRDFLRPARIVLGGADAGALETMKRLYAPIMRTSERFHLMDRKSAELTKYVANAFLATRISFINEVANLCDSVGADVEAVRKAVGSDPRIGPHYFFPGAGWGGSCFPKDLVALVATAQSAGTPLHVVEAAERANRGQWRILERRLRELLGDPLAGRSIAVWGIAFKPQTDDVRHAPALVLIDALLDAGAKVSAHDPVAVPKVESRYAGRVRFDTDAYAVAEGAEALVLVTEWPEYRGLDAARLHRLMRPPRAVVDGRNVYAGMGLAEKGFVYRGVGVRR
jgi:UDPglucose 6-dehydrogenase